MNYFWVHLLLIRSKKSKTHLSKKPDNKNKFIFIKTLYFIVKRVLIKTHHRSPQAFYFYFLLGSCSIARFCYLNFRSQIE